MQGDARVVLYLDIEDENSRQSICLGVIGRIYWLYYISFGCIL